MPNPVRFVKANHHSVWVKWDRYVIFQSSGLCAIFSFVFRVIEDSSGNPIDPTQVTYMLYMKNSIEILRENDEVIVVENKDDYKSPGKRKRRNVFSRGEEYRGRKEGYHFTEFCVRYPGIIRKAK
jgi:hypothetical protein